MPKNKAKVKVKTVVDEVYQNGYCLVVGEPEELQKFADEQNLGYEFEKEPLGGCCIHKGADCFIFVLEKDVSTIVHECVHAAQMSLDYRGVPTCVDNTEGVAYLTQWLFKQCGVFFINYYEKKEKGNLKQKK